MENGKLETATIGGGCFWCVEAVYESLIGVEKVVSGFSGGEKPNPSYEEVLTGRTGHAEVVQLTFDPQKISFEEILNVHFHSHDPTTPNRQGADTGPQYRSIILYHNESQRVSAEKVISEVQNSGLWKNKIVTEVQPYKAFYTADEYHQNYYKNNRTNRYCSLVIAPKLQKLYKEFAHKIKRTR